MAKTIQDFKNFDDALKAEREISMTRSPRERILLLHKLIRGWMKFPKHHFEESTIQPLNRIKTRAD